MENMEPQSPPQALLSKPLMISIVGIMSTAAALVLYHFILTICCARRSNSISQPNQRVGMTTGVEDKVLESIPIIAYSSKQEELFCVDQSECTICLGELEEEELVRLLPNCRHVFHVQCIDEWFFSHSNCPVCRSPVSPTLTPVSLELHMPPAVGEDDEAQLPPAWNHEQRDIGDGDANSPIAQVRSNGLLRHCASLVVPTENKTPQLPMSLKRSLSMDHSYVNLKVQGGHERVFSTSPSSSSSSKGSLLRSNYSRIGSFRHLDRASSVLMKSFSRFGSSSDHNGPSNGILPR